MFSAQTYLLILAAITGPVICDHEVVPGERLVCQEGFHRMGPHCFHIDTTPRNWRESMDYCESLSAQAVVMEKQEKAMFVTSFLTFMRHKLHYKMPISHVVGHYWTSLFRQRANRASYREETWYWKQEHQHIKKMEYFPSESEKFLTPDQAGATMQDCMLVRYDGVWANYWCFETLSSLCETVPRAIK